LFFCKLFKVICFASKVTDKVNKDWKNLSVKLKSHGITYGHITNMKVWIDLEIRLLKQHINMSKNK